MTTPSLNTSPPPTDGNPIALSQFKGAGGPVNTGRQCGFYPAVRYSAAKAMQVWGWRCWGSHNQFGPVRTDGEIAGFYRKNYGVFSMMSKVDVNGDKADPLFSGCAKQPLGHHTSMELHQAF
jgi:glutathione peroxidase-family protein